jgi:hypothetical protein
MIIQFSYSAIKTYEQCPKKYYHTKVAKDFVDEGGEAATYGLDVHAAAEEHTKTGAPIPKKFEYMRPIMASLNAIPGVHHAEVKFGLRKKLDGRYVPVDFDDPKRWYRGIADLLVVNEPKHTAFCIDYKTGKSARYADLKQLDLLAGAVFVHYPQVMLVKSALLYVVSGEFVKKDHVRTDMSSYLGVFDTQLRQLAVSMETNVWNAKESGLCPWCPVTSCPHWRPKRR